MRGKQFEGFYTREKVLGQIFDRWNIPEKTELVPLAEASGRVTAKRLTSVLTLPVCRASACDGIAVRSAEFASGMPDYRNWKMGEEFVRADTGDDFPDSYDTVIPIEEADLDEAGNLLYLSEDLEVRPGDNVSPRGSQIREGDLLIEADRIIRSVDLVCLAMGGISMVPVRKRPVVSFIPTGTELVPAGSHPKRGENIDTNSLLVKDLLQKMGAEPLVFPIVPDLKTELYGRLDEALVVSDIVIINAGTAKGSEDFNFGILGDRGELLSHYVAAAPGRPLATAMIDGKPVINLPGPPMAAFFGMDWCVRNLIAAFLHIPARKRTAVRAELMADIKGTPAMATLCRIELVRTETGCQAWPKSTRSVRYPESMRTNAMIVKDIGVPSIPKGTIIDVELLCGPEFI